MRCQVITCILTIGILTACAPVVAPVTSEPPTYSARGLPEFEVTDRPFDLAIDWGIVDISERQPRPVLDFFALADSAGTRYYSRWGRFHLNSARVIVDERDRELHPRVALPPEPVQIHIREDGLVLAKMPESPEQVEVAVLQIARFERPENLGYVGAGLYVETSASGPPTVSRPALDGRGSIKQGLLDRWEFVRHQPAQD